MEEMEEIDLNDIESVWVDKHGNLWAATASCGCCSDFYGKVYDWKPQPTLDLARAYIERERRNLDKLEQDIIKLENNEWPDEQA